MGHVLSDVVRSDLVRQSDGIVQCRIGDVLSYGAVGTEMSAGSDVSVRCGEPATALYLRFRQPVTGNRPGPMILSLVTSSDAGATLLLLLPSMSLPFRARQKRQSADTDDASGDTNDHFDAGCAVTEAVTV